MQAKPFGAARLQPTVHPQDDLRREYRCRAHISLVVSRGSAYPRG
jgi:hypothetical protein